MEKAQLELILEKHKKYFNGKPDGERADLSYADLSGADLSGANLPRADLSDADLFGANLSGADLTGEKWEVYLLEVVPALLTAGGKTLSEILESRCWDCHEWSNCPMHIAFGINSVEEGPILLRPRIEQFIDLFDKKLIPCPVVKEQEGKV